MCVTMLELPTGMNATHFHVVGCSDVREIQQHRAVSVKLPAWMAHGSASPQDFYILLSSIGWVASKVQRCVGVGVGVCVSVSECVVV